MDASINSLLSTLTLAVPVDPMEDGGCAEGADMLCRIVPSIGSSPEGELAVLNAVSASLARIPGVVLSMTDESYTVLDNVDPVVYNLAHEESIMSDADALLSVGYLEVYFSCTEKAGALGLFPADNVPLAGDFKLGIIEAPTDPIVRLPDDDAGSQSLDVQMDQILWIDQLASPPIAGGGRLSIQPLQISAFISSPGSESECHSSGPNLTVLSMQLLDMAMPDRRLSVPTRTHQQRDVIIQHDLSQIKPEEVAELDALIERITRAASQRLPSSPFSATDNAARPLPLQFDLSQAQRLPAQFDFVDVLPTSEGTPRSMDSSVQQSTPGTAAVGSGGPMHVTSDGHASLRHLVPTHSSLSPQYVSPSEQILVTIQHALRSDVHRVQIRLDPAELGRVEIRMDVTADGRVHLIITADYRDTLEQLQRDVRLLERALQEAGIDADAQNMEFNLNQGSQQDEDQGGLNDAASPIDDQRTVTPQDEGGLLRLHVDYDRSWTSLSVDFKV